MRGLVRKTGCNLCVVITVPRRRIRLSCTAGHRAMTHSGACLSTRMDCGPRTCAGALCVAASKPVLAYALYQGRRKMGGHSRPLRCGSERKKQNASYVLMVFQPRNGADSFGASQFYGRKEMV
ncbi:jg6041 [Pararge aegeria aegeria]|uniref:Jg6041 protein n=1 Tax=Pararge aegeria aegeria TaxID=348720 RepID=A0A8S4QI63_9NEOP|nr:jg6041 [Pararge aegeria aegeria]